MASKWKTWWQKSTLVISLCTWNNSVKTTRVIEILLVTVLQLVIIVPSVLWRCWLGGRKGIRPVKTEWWGAGMVICLERGADLHMAQLTPLPLTVSCFSKIQIGFTFLVPAHLGSPGNRAVKRVCVCTVTGECWLNHSGNKWSNSLRSTVKLWSVR